MTEPFVEPSLGRLYDRKEKMPTWPFVVAAVLIAGFGAMLLTNQAYRPPYLDRTTAQSLELSAPAIAVRVVPLILVVFAALYFGVTRRLAGRRSLVQAPIQALLIVVAAFAGVATVVVQAQLEKDTYAREGRPAMQELLQRTTDRYEQEVLMSHRALNNRLTTVTSRGFFLWSSYRQQNEPDYDRLMQMLEDARGAVGRHRAHIAQQQADAIGRIRRSRISRFGKAEAIHALETRFSATEDLRERHFELANAMLAELEGEVAILERTGATGRDLYSGGVTLDGAANREAFQAHQQRLRELSIELREVTQELVAEGERVQADAVDRAVARRQAEMEEATSAP